MISLAKLRDKLSWRWGGVFALLLAVSAWAVAANEGEQPSQSGRVAKPVYFKGKGDKCVRDASYMRRHHMEELKHHRNETMRQGIRTKDFSLQSCISCHADPQTNSVLGKQGFCASCHSYAAVTIDCFECHASKPKPVAVQAAAPVPAPTAAPSGTAGAEAGPVATEATAVEPTTTGGTSK